MLDGRTILELQDGLSLRRAKVMGRFRVELFGFTDGMVDRLKAMGLLSEIIAWKLRLFVPTGANGPYEESYGKQATIYWNAGAPPHSLQPGQTYHFSVRNRDATGASDCRSVCNAGISTIWPHN